MIIIDDKIYYNVKKVRKEVCPDLCEYFNPTAENHLKVPIGRCPISDELCELPVAANPDLCPVRLDWIKKIKND